MTKADKEHLKNKQFTDSMLISCLVTCEAIISKYAYLERKWRNGCAGGGNNYKYDRLIWMDYREKIRSLLSPIYSMKQIIQMTKSCKDKAFQKDVIEVVGLINKNDYVLV